MTTIGIRLEDKNVWERRVPLVPSDVARLMAEHGLRFVVQPFERRIYQDDEYRAIGAELDDDLSAAKVVFAVKEIPLAKLRADTAYAFFAHVIKGQSYNMPLLRRLLDLRCTLIDYERITNDAGKRLVLFGREAGQAGMIDSLHILGRRLTVEGFPTPLAEIGMAHTYDDLADAKEKIALVGEAIEDGALDLPDLPLVVGFTGRGNVSQGAQEIFDLLPFDEVAPERLESVCRRDEPYYRNRLVKVRFGKEHLAAHREGAPFDETEYRKHPERFRGRLSEFLPFVTVLMTGHFWTNAYPRFFTKADAAEMWRRGEKKLRLIGDVTCDIDGAIEMTYRSTVIDQPTYLYRPADATYEDGLEGDGILVLAIDNLPCELPRDASRRFSHALRDFVAAMAQADYQQPYEALALPPEIHRAVITHRGELTPGYRDLEKHLASSGV